MIIYWGWLQGHREDIKMTPSTFISSSVPGATLLRCNYDPKPIMQFFLDIHSISINMTHISSFNFDNSFDQQNFAYMLFLK